MKKTIIYALASAVLMMSASCQKTPVNKESGDGFLSLGGFSLDLDETVITKSAVAADGTYRISILDADGVEIMDKPYSEVKNNKDMITLPAGTYTLVAASKENVQEAAFEQPVYGVTKTFSISAGEVTEVGQLVCTLTQCKVTVDYSDEFLAAVTGQGSTTVTIKAGHSLEYVLNADKTYNKNAGYFTVEGTTMEVVFKGSIDGKIQKMTKSFTGIAPRQWRQIKFIQKKNEQGQATFDIVINDLISDETLNEDIAPKEEILDPNDPEAPKGDGGIILYPYYEGGCDPDITDLQNIIIKDPAGSEEPTQNITLKAEVPNGVMKFTVDISTTSDGFAKALAAALGEGNSVLDLINPDPNASTDLIFTVVPFPHGPELAGMTEITFPLSKAQIAISGFKGRHTFDMMVVDQQQCRNTIRVVMVVE